MAETQATDAVPARSSSHAPRRLPERLEEQRTHWAREAWLYWLPRYASWLDQIHTWFRVLHRKVLTPRHLPTLAALDTRVMDFIDHRSCRAKPITWSYTTPKLIETFGTN